MRKNVTILGEHISDSSYPIKVYRHFRAKDLVFRGAMALAAALSTTGIGCGTDIHEIWNIICRRHAVIDGLYAMLSIAVQISIRGLILPVVCLVTGLLFNMSHSTIAGLLLWSTTYGGGISYILNSAVNTHEDLSMFLEIGATLVSIG